MQVSKANALIRSIATFLRACFCASERTLPCQHLKEHYTQSIHICGRCDRFPADLFGGHIGCGPGRGHSSCGAFGMTGNPEICQIDISTLVYEYIAWLDITMHYSIGMCIA